MKWKYNFKQKKKHCQTLTIEKELVYVFFEPRILNHCGIWIPLGKFKRALLQFYFKMSIFTIWQKLHALQQFNSDIKYLIATWKELSRSLQMNTQKRVWRPPGYIIGCVQTKGRWYRGGMTSTLSSKEISVRYTTTQRQTYRDIHIYRGQRCGTVGSTVNAVNSGSTPNIPHGLPGIILELQSQE